MFYIMEAIVTDREAYSATVDQWIPMARTAERFGGVMKICGGRVEVIVGDWMPKNLLVMEFPDKDSLDAWTSSEDYADLIEVVSQSADLHVVTAVGA